MQWAGQQFSRDIEAHVARPGGFDEPKYLAQAQRAAHVGTAVQQGEVLTIDLKYAECSPPHIDEHSLALGQLIGAGDYKPLAVGAIVGDLPGDSAL
jgi:hypothetical protein